jgi:uncharacterized membrane protein
MTGDIQRHLARTLVDERLRIARKRQRVIEIGRERVPVERTSRAAAFRRALSRTSRLKSRRGGASTDRPLA